MAWMVELTANVKKDKKLQSQILALKEECNGITFQKWECTSLKKPLNVLSCACWLQSCGRPLNQTPCSRVQGNVFSSVWPAGVESDLTSCCHLQTNKQTCHYVSITDTERSIPLNPTQLPLQMLYSLWLIHFLCWSRDRTALRRIGLQGNNKVFIFLLSSAQKRITAAAPIVKTEQTIVEGGGRCGCWAFLYLTVVPVHYCSPTCCW